MLPDIAHDSTNTEREAIENLTRLLQFIFRLDKKAMVLPWNDPIMSTIQLGSDVPQDRRSLEDYVERDFIKQGKNTWAKFLLAHNVDPQEFILDVTWMKKNRTSIYICKLQEKKTADAGWLFGSHKTTNKEDLADAINLHPSCLAKGIRVQIKMKHVVTRSDKKWPQWSQWITAAHITCATSHLSQCRVVMNGIYGASSHSNYPHGQEHVIRPKYCRYPLPCHTHDSIYG
jgi:hypothetical protein